MCHYRLIASVGGTHLEYVEFPEGTYKKLIVTLRTLGPNPSPSTTSSMNKQV